MFEAMCRSFRALDPEFITVYYGEDAKEEDAEHVSEIFRQRFPDAEVSLVSGGQPVYYYMISVE